LKNPNIENIQHNGIHSRTQVPGDMLLSYHPLCFSIFLSNICFHISCLYHHICNTLNILCKKNIMIQLLPVKFECWYRLVAHTTTDRVITVKNHQTQSQTKYGKNQYQAFLKFIGFCNNWIIIFFLHLNVVFFVFSLLRHYELSSGMQ
jgi:hypothetical protein